MTITAKQIKTALDANQIVNTEDFDAFMIPGGRIYWDDQDPANSGWSFELWETDCYGARMAGSVDSGAIDELAEMATVIAHAKQNQ